MQIPLWVVWTSNRRRPDSFDDPRSAVANADRLVNEVIKARGYPVGDFEQRAADISVDHSLVVTNYRVAHEIALRDAGGETSTDELNQELRGFAQPAESQY